MLEPKKKKNPIAGSSNKSFGLVFTVFFTFLGVYPLYYHNPVRIWAIASAAALLLITLTFPSLLTYPNKLWTLIGLLIHKVTNPVIMGLIFFFLITPIALIMRITGKIPLKLKFERNIDSYWILRKDIIPQSENFKNQF